jgi:hypothetical protein
MAELPDISLIFLTRSLLCAQDEDIIHSIEGVLDVINQSTAHAERGDHRLNLGRVILTVSMMSSNMTFVQLTYTTKRLIWITDASQNTNFSKHHKIHEDLATPIRFLILG